MTITRPEWPWYIAEFVISESCGNEPLSYAVHGYLLKASSAETAFQEALSLQTSLNDSIRNSNGKTIDYRCLGLFNLDSLQVEQMEHGVHLSVIPWVPGSMPAIKQKHELSLFK